MIELPARLPGLRDFHQRRADTEAVTNTDFRLRQTVRAEVLAEGTGAIQHVDVAAMRRKRVVPDRIVVARIVVQRLLRAAVMLRIALLVDIEAELRDANRPADHCLFDPARPFRAERLYPARQYGGNRDVDHRIHQTPPLPSTVQTSAHRHWPRRADFTGTATDRARINAGAPQFDRMPDQPGFDIARLDLGVELQRQHMRADGIGLVRRGSGGGKQFGAGGQVEGIAVPVQHLPVGLGQRGQRRTPTSFRGRDRRPADFARARIHARTGSGCNQLRTQARTDHWPLCMKTVTNDGDLGFEPRIGFGLIDADRAAEHHKQIGWIILHQCRSSTPA
jgi:hypothetical protein